MTKEEIKLRLFESIVANSSNLCDTNRYMNPENVARYTNEVYDILFNQNE